jgi:hypothetical protein
MQGSLPVAPILAYAGDMRAMALAMVTALAVAMTATAEAKVKAPEGDYTGPRKMFMRVTDKTIEIIAFNFPCKKHPKARGRTSLNDIALRKTDEGYKFSTKVFGIVTYSDEHVDQNGVTSISGQWGRKGGFVRGRFQSSTRYCGPTGKLDWKANRAKDQAR